jgi:hypothetical protein
MRQWIRSHMTYANVMVTLLAFIVLGGGTALASYVISSNSQVGPGTISGHHAPSGKNPNLIAGSVGSRDVADHSLTNDDIKGSTVAPDAFGRFHDALMQVPSGSGINGNPRAGDEDVLSLDVPAGNYFIVAKGTLSWTQQGHARCFLYADGDHDYLDIYSNGPFYMSVLGGSPDPFTIHLACNDKRQNVQAFGGGMLDLKINAIGVRNITNTAG